jgi:hypothetical protein
VCSNRVLSLHQSAREMPGLDVPQSDVTHQRAEQRDTFTNQYRNASDDKPLNQPGAKKFLNRDAAIDVKVRESASRKPGNNFLRRSCHLFNNSTSNAREIERTAAEHDYTLAAVRPLRIRKYGIECLAPITSASTLAKNSSYPWGSPPPGGRKSRAPFGRAIYPSTLVPMKTDEIMTASL